MRAKKLPPVVVHILQALIGDFEEWDAVTIPGGVVTEVLVGQGAGVQGALRKLRGAKDARDGYEGARDPA